MTRHGFCQPAFLQSRLSSFFHSSHSSICNSICFGSAERRSLMIPIQLFASFINSTELPVNFFLCGEVSDRMVWSEKRKVRRQRGGRGAGTLTGEPSASGRVLRRTHRVVQRIDMVHERVDRVLQSSLGQTRVSREKATGATLSKSTRKRSTSSGQEPRQEARDVGERIKRVHERVDRIHQGSLEQARVPRVRARRPGAHPAARDPAKAREGRSDRLDVAPHGALGGFAQATAALVTSSPTSTSGGSRLGDGGSSVRGRLGEAVGVEKGVPVAVGVRLGSWQGNRGSLSRACRGARSVVGRTRRARSRLRCARELSRRDRWAALDGQARDQSRLSEGDGATRGDGGNAGAAPRGTLRYRRRRARTGASSRGPQKSHCSNLAGPRAQWRGGRSHAVTGAEAATGTAGASEPVLPITLERPDAMDSSSSASAVNWAASRRRSSLRDMSAMP